jgi:hypothetical protein
LLVHDFAVKENLSVGDELVEKIEVGDVASHYGTTEFACLEVDEGVVEAAEFGAGGVGA